MVSKQTAQNISEFHEKNTKIIYFFPPDLIVKESDNNVKLIVLDRLIAMKESPSHERILQELVMDILRVLSSPDLEVRRKTLTLAMDLVTSRNIDELVNAKT